MVVSPTLTLRSLVGARTEIPVERNQTLGISCVAGADEKLEGANSQNGAQNGIGRQLTIEDGSQGRMCLNLVQWPLVPSEELGQSMFLDA